MPGSVLLLAAAVAIAAPADQPVRTSGARVSAIASVTVLMTGRSGEWMADRQAWRSLSREAGQVLTCFE